MSAYIPNLRVEGHFYTRSREETEVLQRQVSLMQADRDRARPTSWEDVHESINQIKQNLFEHLEIEDPDSYENTDIKVRRKLVGLLNNYSWRSILENEPSLSEADCPTVLYEGRDTSVYFGHGIKLKFEYRGRADWDYLSLPEPIYRALEDDFYNIDVFLWWLISRGLFPSVPSPSQVLHLLVILNSWLYKGGAVPYLRGFNLLAESTLGWIHGMPGEIYHRVGEYPVEITFTHRNADEPSGTFRSRIRTKFIRFDIPRGFSRYVFESPDRNKTPIEIIFKCVDDALEASSSTLIVPIHRFNPRVTWTHTPGDEYTFDMSHIIDQVHRTSRPQTVWTPQEEIAKTNGKHPPIKTKFLEGWEQ